MCRAWGQRHINIYIKSERILPLQVLQRRDDTDPAEMDEIIRVAWHPVYHGNVQHFHNIVDKFFAKYDAHTHRAPTTEIELTTWQDLKYACTHGAHTAGG